MNRYFIRYPGFRTKALTLSYDDGAVQDARLIEIMTKHGVKGTFNLNGRSYTAPPRPQGRRLLTREEALALYPAAGQEVAVHSYSHPFLEQLPRGNAAWEIVRDREILEGMFGCIVRGMGLPHGYLFRRCGRHTAPVWDCLRQDHPGVPWLRPAGGLAPLLPHLPSPGSIPPPALCQEFLSMDVRWGVKLFCLWGHSYEFDEQGNWDLIERFCETMGGREYIYYATCGEIHDYLEAAAASAPPWTAPGSRIRRPPPSISLWTGKTAPWPPAKPCCSPPSEPQGAGLPSLLPMETALWGIIFIKSPCILKKTLIR